jgi:hypothetical protein
LPQLWFRNTWDWFAGAAKPSLRARDDRRIAINHPAFDSPWTADFDGPQQLLFCDNETNVTRVFGQNRGPRRLLQGRIPRLSWFTDIISMPDKWEYPWYAAWDLAFHTIWPGHGRSRLCQKPARTCSCVIAYLHPNGQIPAYEWNFGDVNPPVHAWATLFVFRIDKETERPRRHGISNAAFQKLLLNFTWWLNRKDRKGAMCSRAAFWGWTTSASSTAVHRCRRAAFWSRPTARPGWRSYCQQHAGDALELAPTDPALWREHGVSSSSSTSCGSPRRWTALASIADEMWDEEDGFFYDVLRFPTARPSA